MLCGAGVLAAARPPQVSAPPAFGVGLAARRNGPSRAVRRRAALPSVEVTPEIGAKAGLLAEWLSEAYDVIDYAEVNT